MRLWFTLLAAVTLMAGVVGCNSSRKWHECRPGEACYSPSPEPPPQKQ